jgi:two-component sensor histidine kinase
MRANAILRVSSSSPGIVLPVLGALVRRRVQAIRHSLAARRLGADGARAQPGVPAARADVRRAGALDAWTRASTGRVPSLLAALGVFALVGAWMSALGRGEVAPLLLVAPIVLLIWTNHAIGGAWSWIVWSISCTACLWLSTLGTGPLVHESERATVIHLQWWAIGTSVVLLLLTTLREQRGIARMPARFLRTAGPAGAPRDDDAGERTQPHRARPPRRRQPIARFAVHRTQRPEAPRDASSRERIEAMQEHLLGVSDDIRRLSHELHPSMLRYTSLAASLEALCASHSREELEVHCETEETFSLSEQQKLELFRIAQEALHNAEKHADASRVHIALRRDGDGALLRIQDDGCGLPEDYASARHGGLGMISMAERVKTLRGQLQFASVAEGGTRVDVAFPWAGPFGRSTEARCVEVGVGCAAPKRRIGARHADRRGHVLTSLLQACSQSTGRRTPCSGNCWPKRSARSGSCSEAAAAPSSRPTSAATAIRSASACSVSRSPSA